MAIDDATCHVGEDLLLPLAKLASVDFLANGNWPLDGTSALVVVLKLAGSFDLFAQISVVLICNRPTEGHLRF